MATLFERLTSQNIDPNSDETTIAIHMLGACVSEVWRLAQTGQGMTGGRAVEIMQLTSAQITDIQTIQTAFGTAADKVKFLQRLFDYLALGEMKVTEYMVESNFWAFIASEGAQ